MFMAIAYYVLENFRVDTQLPQTDQKLNIITFGFIILNIIFFVAFIKDNPETIEASKIKYRYVWTVSYLIVIAITLFSIFAVDYTTIS